MAAAMRAPAEQRHSGRNHRLSPRDCVPVTVSSRNAENLESEEAGVGDAVNSLLFR